MPLVDTLGRPLRHLRISVTDRCNLRCSYCMPEESYVWLPRSRLLSFEEIATLVDAMIALGVDRVRLTGGEPLLRHELHKLVRSLANKSGLREIALTTNGLLLADQAAALLDAGLGRLTVSLDTLRPERFAKLTRRDAHATVLQGIDAAVRAGFSPPKIDAVIVRGQNDDELGDLIAYGRSTGSEVRFIEYMDVGGATNWSSDAVVSRAEMLARIAERFGPVEPLPGRGAAPAERFALSDGTSFGIIASTTAPFCRACDRSRLTADGRWFLCLYAEESLDLRAILRSGSPASAITEALTAAWQGRADRGAEARREGTTRGPLIPAARLKREPHLEMHTRGG